MTYNNKKNKTGIWGWLANDQYPLRYLLLEGFLAILIILAIIFLIFWI